jgi:hypothetical protein
MATGLGVIGYLICMWLGALLLAIGGFPKMAAVWFIVVPFAYVGLGFWRVFRFRSASRALSTFLDDIAARSTTIAAEPTIAPVVLAESPIPASFVPPPPPAVNASPAWFTDPTGRHDHRFWDGTSWTERVADAGVSAVDPL